MGIAIDETPIPYIYDSTISVLQNRIFKSPCEETRKLMEESKTILNCNVSYFIIASFEVLFYNIFIKSLETLILEIFLCLYVFKVIFRKNQLRRIFSHCRTAAIIYGTTPFRHSLMLLKQGTRGTSQMEQTFRQCHQNWKVITIYLKDLRY